MTFRRLLQTICALAMQVVLFGCDGSDSAPIEVSSQSETSSSTSSTAPATEAPRERHAAPDPPQTEPDVPSPTPTPIPKPPPVPLLSDLLLEEEEDFNATGDRFHTDRPRLVIDEDRARSKGIRKITGKHLVLYTDLAESKEIDELPAVFDLAVPQWGRYFGIEAAKYEDWRITGFLMKDKARFLATGLLPADLPPFLNGFHRDYELWLYEQPSAYYRRHLLLHEGTHGFMYWFLGSTGPPWYAEGMAELLGTHRWKDGELTVGYFPKDRRETPQWGRIKIVRDEFQASRALELIDIMKYDSRVYLQNEPYGWSWAIAAFLDANPLTQKPFRQLRSEVADRSLEFSRQFYERLRPDWPRIVEQWQLFVIELDYGYDVARASVSYKPGQPLPAVGQTVTINADSGWQSTGIRLEAGVTYQISASGRYQVTKLPQPWWCEPGGVTIRYDRGRPLGILLAALRDDQWKSVADSLTPLAEPIAIGLGREITLERSGTLYLRINESSSGLADNSGELTARVIAQ